MEKRLLRIEVASNRHSYLWNDPTVLRNSNVLMTVGVGGSFDLTKVGSDITILKTPNSRILGTNSSLQSFVGGFWLVCLNFCGPGLFCLPKRPSLRGQWTSHVLKWIWSCLISFLEHFTVSLPFYNIWTSIRCISAHIITGGKKPFSK